VPPCAGVEEANITLHPRRLSDVVVKKIGEMIETDV
jgi:hypothetical protein